MLLGMDDEEDERHQSSQSSIQMQAAVASQKRKPAYDTAQDTFMI